MFKAFCAAVLAVVWIGMCASVAFAEPIKVRVGGYPFEPFVEEGLGVTPGFVALLNSHQRKYRFEFIQIPAQRRYDLMESGKIDAIFFEMLTWGWENKEKIVAATKPIVAGREVFVVLRDHQDAEAILLNPTRGRMALTLGYHYAFADFVADQAYLKAHFNVVFAPKQRTAIKYLLTGSADVALASDIFLHAEYQRDSDLEQKLIVSEKADQLYQLPHLVRRHGRMTVETLHALMDGLMACDCLSTFLASYGLEQLLIYQPE